MRTLRLVTSLLYATVAASPVAAQTIRGRVLDAASGEPVPQVAVTAVDADQHGVGHARSSADGAFAIPLRGAGTFRLRGERTGYQPALSQPVEVAVRETVIVALRVSVQPTQIEPLIVAARQSPPRKRVLELNGFYDREAFGMGRFLRREDFDRNQTDNLVHVLARVPGVELTTNRRGIDIVSFTRGRTVGTLSRAQRSQMDVCFPAVYLDGSRVTYGDQSGRGADPFTPDLNNIVSADQVEAVELYRSAAELPPQFNGSNAACGAIVIWTRHDISPPSGH